MKTKFLIGIITLVILSASFVFAQTDASVTPLTPGWGGTNYDQRLWNITYNKAIIPVSFTSYHCTSAALVLEYATWADYTKLDWQTGATGKYTGFIPASTSDLSQKVNITIPNLSPSTSYIFRVGAKCTSSSPMGSLAYTTSANQFSTPAAPSSPTQSGDVTPPNAPGNLQISDVTATHVALSWNTPADNIAVTRYELKYKTGDGTFLESDWTSASSLPVPGAPPTGIMGVATFGYNEFTPNTTYILGLKAYDAVGNASPLAVSPNFTTLAPPPPSIPVAPTGLTASYSTFPNGPEIQLNVNDNAINETEYRLYWRLKGSAWSGTFQPTGTSTWSFPTNIGNIQIAAPKTAGTYEYQIHACNTEGCSSSNIASVDVPATTIVNTTPPNICTSVTFELRDNKTSYTTGDMVNYSYSCLPAGTSATSVTIQVLKPDGTAITYVTGGNVGAVLQQMGFSTSNLAAGSYVLRACLNDTSCAVGSVYPLPFTVVSAVVTPLPVTQTPTPTSVPNQVSTHAAAPTPETALVPSIPTNTMPSAPAGSGGPSVIPIPVQVVSKTPSTQAIPEKAIPATSEPVISSLSGFKCKNYLSDMKSTLDTYKRYIKNIKRKMKGAPKNYVNADTISDSLSRLDEALADAKNNLKKKECSATTLSSIREKQRDANDEFQDLSGYDKDELQYFSAYNQCQSSLANRTKKITALIKKEKNKETRSSLKDSAAELLQKNEQFAQDAADAFFPEVIVQCKEYMKGFDRDVNFYLRVGK